MELWCGKLGGAFHYDVVRNSAQITPTHHAFGFFLEENPAHVHIYTLIFFFYLTYMYMYGCMYMYMYAYKLHVM